MLFCYTLSIHSHFLFPLKKIFYFNHN